KVEAHDVDGAKKDAEDAKKLFEEAKAAAEDCYKKAEQAINDVPEDVKKVVQSIVEKVKTLLPKEGGESGPSPVSKLIAEIEKGIGKAAAECQKRAEKAKKTFDEAKAKNDAGRG